MAASNETEALSILGCLLVHCYSTVDIIWKLHSCWSQYCKHHIIVQGKTHCIFVSEWDMKLGIVPLWSALKELSNDVLKVIFWCQSYFCQNCTQPKAWFFAILSQYSTNNKMDISIHANHNGANLIFISHS